MTRLAGLVLFWTIALPAVSQSPQSAPPQTARQALLEMFFSKTQGTFVKHLPAATVAALNKAGAFDKFQQYSLLAGQLHANGAEFETFETGSILLSTKDPKTGNKLEVIVQSDSLQGNEDNLELSFLTYKDSQPQRTPYMSSVTFSMKMESGVWKLNEIDLTVRVPLADPDFLKTITDAAKSKSTAGPLQIQSHQSIAPTAPDASIIAAMRTIVAAETTYRSTYPTTGFTCTLTDLDGFGGGAPNEHQAMLIPSSLAGGHRYGYTFTLSGCSGIPFSNFEVIATPSTAGAGRHTFCADQTGAIRYSESGPSSACVSSGVLLQ